MGSQNNRVLLRTLLREAGAYFQISDRNNIVKYKFSHVDRPFGAAPEPSDQVVAQADFSQLVGASPLPKDIDVLIEDLIQGTDGSRPMLSWSTTKATGTESTEEVVNPGFISILSDRMTSSGDTAAGPSGKLYREMKSGAMWYGIGNWTASPDKAKADALAPMLRNDTTIYDTIYTPNFAPGNTVAAVTDRATWEPDTGGSLEKPAISVFSMYDDFLCRGAQDVGLVQLFASGIPSTELAMCVPYLDVRIMDSRNPNIYTTDGDTHRHGPTITASKFIKGFGDLTEEDKNFAQAASEEQVLKAAAGEESLESSGGSIPVSSAGMELFTMPQTFVGPSEKYIDLNPDGQMGASKRPQSVRDPFQPFMTITGFDYSVESSNTIMSTLRGKLNIVLHDRSRLHEAAPLLRPDRTAGLEILIEWGWSHPHQTGTNYFGRLLNACRTKRKFVVATSSYQFNADGSVNITLNMFAKGNRTIGLDLVSARDGGTSDITTKMEELARELNKAITFALGDTPDLRTQSKAIFGNPAVIGRFTSVDGMLSIPTSELKELELAVKDGAAGTNEYIKYRSVTREATFTEIKGTVNSCIAKVIEYRKHLDDTYANIIKCIETAGFTGDLLDHTATSPAYKVDPWRVAWEKKQAYFYNAENNEDDVKFKGFTTAQFNNDNYISLGRLLTVFLIPTLKEKRAWQDIQLYFYPANEDSYGYSQFQTIGSIPVRKDAYLKTFKTFRDTTPNPSLLQWLAFTLDFVEKDYSSAGYGLGMAFESEWDESRGAYKTKKAVEGKVASGGRRFGYGRRMAESSHQIYGHPRKFKKPEFKVDVETIPFDKDEGKSILRVHISDASKDSYSTFSEFLQKSSSDALSVISKRVDNHKQGDIDNTIDGFQSDPWNVGTYLPAEATLIAQFEKLSELGFLKKVESPTTDSESKVHKRYVEQMESYMVMKGVGQIKYFLQQNLPTLKYGTEFSIMNNVTVSAQTDEALAMIQLRNRVQGGGDPGEGDGSFPMQLFPVTLSIETIGCPFFRHGQQFFFDYGTNTDIDNIYIVTGVDHSIKPGSYSSKLRLARVDKYGFFQTLEQRMTEIDTIISAMK